MRLPTHFNQHRLCAIDIETTGLNWRKNSIWQLGIVAIDLHYEVCKDTSPFSVTIKPEEGEEALETCMPRHKKKVAEALVSGVESEEAVTLFEDWIEKELKLLSEKRILPLAHNWVFERDFLQPWLGVETFDYYFDGRYRDTQVMAAMLLDLDAVKATNYELARIDLGSLCTRYGIDRACPHEALSDALDVIRVYNKLLLSFKKWL